MFNNKATFLVLSALSMSTVAVADVNQPIQIAHAGHAGHAGAHSHAGHNMAHKRKRAARQVKKAVRQRNVDYPAWYISGDIGALFADGDFNAGSTTIDIGNDTADAKVAGAAVGYDVGRGSPWRFEAEYRGRKADADDLDNTVGGNRFAFDGDIESESLMFNALYDLNGSGSVRPYLKAGIGAARNKVDNLSLSTTTSLGTVSTGFSDDTDDSFAWAVGAGLELPFSQRTSLGLEYQYIDLGDIELGTGANAISFENIGHEVSVGITHKF